MKKCKGCGAVLQTENTEEIGYTVSLEKEICNRCFRLKHYAEYKMVSKDKSEYEKILKEIDETGDLIVLVVDTFLMGRDVFNLTFKSPVLLALSKRDIMPLSIREESMKSYMDTLAFKPIGIEWISTKKNTGLDSLYEKIQKLKKSKNVYMVGFTNAGKSSLINKILYNYADREGDLVTSIMPSTTLDSIEVPVSDTLTLIDTPGLLTTSSLMNEVGGTMLSKVMPQKEMKPKTYQITAKQYINIEDFLQIELSDTNVTLFFSNRLMIERTYKKKHSYPYHVELCVLEGEDIVIEGLGFIKVTKKAKFRFELLYDIAVYTRKTLVGQKER